MKYTHETERGFRIEIMNNDGMAFRGISREGEMSGNSKDYNTIGCTRQGKNI